MKRVQLLVVLALSAAGTGAARAQDGGTSEDTIPAATEIAPPPPESPPPESPPPATAQPAPPKPPPAVSMTGRLRERGTRLPLPGVLVTVFRDDGNEPIGFEATSDGEGRFQLYDLAPGPWKVLVEAPGYYPFRTSEEVRPGETVNLTYYVEKGDYNPYDVTVTASRPRKEVSRTVISVKEADKVPGTFGDPLAVVQNFAGVARTPSFSGLLVVRGSAPEDTRTFVDGADVPFIYHFGGLRSVIPVGMLESIDFYPGNFGPAYGRATGGVIDVQLKKLAPARVGGYADLSLLDANLYLEAPLGTKGAVAIAGRRSHLDFLINAAVPDDAGVRLLTTPRYYDYQLLANYRPAPGHDLRAMVFGSDDRFALLFQNPADFDPQVTSGAFSAATTFYRVLAQYRFVPGPRFENNLRVSNGRDRIDNSIGNLALRFNVASTQLRDNVRWSFGERLALSAGADVLFARVGYDVRLPRPPKEGEPPSAFDATAAVSARADGLDFWSPAGFVEAEVTPGRGLTLLPGLRLDHFGRVSETVLQPRLTARWRATPSLAAKGGVGLFAQEPDIDETDGTFGNPALKAERAIHTSAGLEWKPLAFLGFDVTGFYKDLRNLVSRTDRTATDATGAARPLVYDNGGSGHVWGFEVVARHELTHRLTGWIAYTYSRSLRRDSGQGLERRFDFDQPHVLTAVASVLLPRNWQVGGRYRLVSGNPYTPVTGSVFNAGADRYDPTYGAVNTARNDLFHQLDVRIDKRWVYARWMLDVYLDLQNVYNRPNPEGRSYNFDFTQTKAEQGLPILTVLGVRAEL